MLGCCELILVVQKDMGMALLLSWNLYLPLLYSNGAHRDDPLRLRALHHKLMGAHGEIPSCACALCRMARSLAGSGGEAATRSFNLSFRFLQVDSGAQVSGWAPLA